MNNNNINKINNSNENNIHKRGCYFYFIYGLPTIVLICIGGFAYIPFIILILCIAIILKGLDNKEIKGKIYTTIGICGLTIYVIFILLSVTGKDVGPWEGKVVDIKSGEPLKEAVVLVLWYGEAYGIIDWDRFFHRATEVVTDNNGYFYIPRYFPFNFLPLLSRIENPQFIVFKPGYLFVDNANSGNFSIGTKIMPVEITMNLSNEYVATYIIGQNLLELPSLAYMSKDDRIKYWFPHTPSAVPQNKMIEFNNAIKDLEKKINK